MASKDVIYLLKIVSAESLPPSMSGKPPNAYVDVKVLTQKFSSKRVHRNAQPTWNQEFLLKASDVSTAINLKVQHDSSFSPLGSFLCGVSIEISKLLSDCKDADGNTTKLQLHDEKGAALGSIIISLKPRDSTNVASSAIAQAKEDVNALEGGIIPVIVGALNPDTLTENTNTALDVMDAFEPLHNISTKIRGLMDIIEKTAKVHPYADFAFTVVASVYKVVQGQIERDEQVVGLVRVMDSVYSFVDAIQNVREKVALLEATIQAILNQTVECTLFIQEYTGKGFTKRILHELASSDGERMTSLKNSLLELKKEFDADLNVQNVFASGRIMYDVNAIMVHQNLDTLKHAQMDTSSRIPCLPGTRQDVLNFINRWVALPYEGGDKNALFLHGLAGSGKSSLATTVANHFRELRRLGAFLFFDRSAVDRSHPSKVVRTLAYQLAKFDQRIAEKVSEAIANNPRISESPLQLQFSKLLIEPLSSVEFSEGGAVLIVFDALDECGTPSERSELLKLLAQDLSRIPKNFRILITGRPEIDIQRAFNGRPNILSQELDVTSTATKEDIASYLRHTMSALRKIHSELDHDWPGEDIMKRLEAQAAGLFIWAATAARFIDAFDPPSQLNSILQGKASTKAEKSLDSLYQVALGNAGDWDDEGFLAAFRAVVGVVLIARQPLSIHSIDSLLQSSTSSRAVSQLACVLQQTPMLRALHPSFADFLQNRERCGRDQWYFGSATLNLSIAEQCLSLLDRSLKTNLCDLSLSVPLTRETPSESVAYASLFWMDHVCSIQSDTSGIIPSMDKFFNQHLLHWFEVMSILKESRRTIPLLERLMTWVSKQQAPPSLQALVRDAFRFACQFAGCFEEHPLHVYMSALPFTPKDTALFKAYHNSKCYPTLVRPIEHTWSPQILMVKDVAMPSSGAAVSHDRKQVVVSNAGGWSSDTPYEIHLLDTHSGAQLLQPITGHTDTITSFAFTPSGDRIISASKDTTIRVWDARVGSELKVLNGHSGPVNSLAISSDGSQIVSGSEDMALRIWNLDTGATLQTLQGHTASVSSVDISNNGQYILSASQDSTIRIWNAISGAEIHNLMQPTGVAVSVVAFSPNGIHFASGSSAYDDQKVRLFSSEAGTKLLEVAIGDSISCLAFSRCGTKLVVGGGDAIRILDTNSGSTLVNLGPQSRWPRCAVLSPEGDRIISVGRHLHIFDVTSNPLIESSGNDDDYMGCTAFMLDGRHALSGGPKQQEGGHEITLWDAETGQIVRTMRGPEQSITSIVPLADESRILTQCSDPTNVTEPSSEGSIDYGSLDYSSITFRIWNISGTEETVIKATERFPMSFTPFLNDSRLMLTHKRTIRVLETSTGAELLRLRANKIKVRRSIISADGSRVVAVTLDGDIMVWDGASGAEIRTWQSQQIMVTSISASTDGSRIASASSDMKVRIWDASSGTEQGCISHESEVASVIMSPDGTRLLCSLENGENSLWDTRDARRLSPVEETEYFHQHDDMRAPVRGFVFAEALFPSRVWRAAYTHRGDKCIFVAEDRLYIMHLPLSSPLFAGPAART